MYSERNRSATRLVLPVFLTVATVLAGCTNDADEAIPSIDEIHAAEGVPVSVRPLDRTTFRQYLSFTTSLTGASESTASSMLSDAVAGVLYQVGDYVEADTPVVLFPPDNPTLNYEQARVSFESARTAFERVQRLYEDDGVSQQAYDDARTQFELARANWNSVQNMARVKAPISGYITRLNVLESDNVAPGDPLFTVADFSELKTTVWLTDRQVNDVSVGQPAVARWQNVTVPGEVVQVDMAMDQNRKAFAAKLRFDNDDLRVSSGVTAVVEIETYRNTDAIILNNREIVDDDGTSYVYFAENDRAVRRRVEILRRQGLIAEIAFPPVGTEAPETERSDSETAEPADQTGTEPPSQRIITRGIEQIEDGITINVVDEEPRLVQR